MCVCVCVSSPFIQSKINLGASVKGFGRYFGTMNFMNISFIGI